MRTVSAKTGSDGPGLPTRPEIEARMARMPAYVPKAVRRARASSPSPVRVAEPFWQVRNADADTAEILLYDSIGFDWFGDGVTAAGFARDLAAIKSKNLVVRVNSPGGDVFDGLAIKNLLEDFDGKVTARIDGLAASIASVIIMAADEIEAGRHSQVMIHDASGFAMGNSADMTEMAELLDMISDNIASIYAERVKGTTAEEWRAIMKGERWYTAEEAVEAGLVTRVAAPRNAASDAMCPECDGTGKTGGKTCPMCEGTGVAPEEDDEAQDANGGDCPTCDGTGKIKGGKVTCPECDGTGEASSAEDLADALSAAVRRAYRFDDLRLPSLAPGGLVKAGEPARDWSPETVVHIEPSGGTRLADVIKGGLAVVPVPSLADLFAGFAQNMPEGKREPERPVDLGPLPERPAEPEPVHNVLAEAVRRALDGAAVNQPEGPPPEPAGPVDLGPAPERPTPEPLAPPRNPLAEIIGAAVTLAATNQPEPESATPPEPEEYQPPLRLDVKGIRRAVTESRF